jgi:UDP-N-acetylglucosamine--N-acetylmuramyl-(pentapeptide) pyrophosphoryl-undecaprenol N-acetylglucosamine transferase
VDDHQTANARYLADGGAARIVQQREFDKGLLEETLKELLGEPERLLRMGRRAHQLAMRDAARHAADLCIEILEGGRS